jgi:hypothetical protein
MVITLNKFFVSQESSFPRQRLDIAAMFSFASYKLSATSLSPNPALAKHFFTVSTLIFFTANRIQFTHPELIQILLTRNSYLPSSTFKIKGCIRNRL